MDELRERLTKEFFSIEYPPGGILYRVFHLEHFLDLIGTGLNTLVRPTEWHDPWEHWFYELMLRRTDWPPMPADVFGQCWTLHSETDAMWRVYAPAGSGVKVQVECSVMMRPSRFPCNMNLISIQYRTEKELIELFSVLQEFVEAHGGQREAPEDPATSKMNAAFLSKFRYQYKRVAFEWEREVRIMSSCPDHVGPRLRIPVDLGMIREVVFDPRMGRATCAIVEKAIRDAGIQCPISRSRLYSLDLD